MTIGNYRTTIIPMWLRWHFILVHLISVLLHVNSWSLLSSSVLYGPGWNNPVTRKNTATVVDNSSQLLPKAKATRNHVTRKNTVAVFENSSQLLSKVKAITSQDWSVLGSSDSNPVCGAPATKEEITRRISGILMVRLAALRSSVVDPDHRRAYRADDLTEASWDNLLPSGVVRELGEYVTTILDGQNDVQYHNVHHIYHVVVSANKLLDGLLERDTDGNLKRTYGIRSNPLYGMAFMFAALTHDVDHQGVPNGQLVEEENEVALLHKESVAERHSIDLSIRELNSPKYKELRKFIFRNKEEHQFFERLVTDLVLSTDIFTPERSSITKSKWNEAFGNASDLSSSSASSPSSECPHDSFFDDSPDDLKASVVLETLLLTADVANTMQDWERNRIWSSHLYHEMKEAFDNKRSRKHPADGWLDLQSNFLEGYVLPLAQRTQHTGVFGKKGSNVFSRNAALLKETWVREGEDFLIEVEEIKGEE